MNVTETLFNNYNIKINVGKIKVITSSTNSGKKRLNIKIGNEKIREISEFCYLGSKIKRDNRFNPNIGFRIGQLRKRLPKYNNYWFQIRMKRLKIYVWSVALYGCKAWTIK